VAWASSGVFKQKLSQKVKEIQNCSSNEKEEGMKKIHLSGLQQGAKGFTEKVANARAHYDVWKAKLKDLDGPKAKRDYTPVKLQELRTEAKNEALKAVRDIQAGMQEIAGRVLPQRKRWSKAALLREQRFYDVPKGMSYLEKDLQHMAAVESLNASRELRALIWAQRLDDDSLLAAITDAVDVEELPLLSVLVSEAGNRKKDGAMYQLKVNEALKPISFPETVEAEKAFGEMEFALEEIQALEHEIREPTSSFAQGHASFFPVQRAINARKAAEAEAAEAAKKAKTEEAVKLLPAVPSPFVPVEPEAEPQQPSAA
jgi:hypothetical protein